jgi:hypothetical protein
VVRQRVLADAALLQADGHATHKLRARHFRDDTHGEFQAQESIEQDEHDGEDNLHLDGSAQIKEEPEPQSQHAARHGQRFQPV